MHSKDEERMANNPDIDQTAQSLHCFPYLKSIVKPHFSHFKIITEIFGVPKLFFDFSGNSGRRKIELQHDKTNKMMCAQ